jgi:hypothetical protein
MLLEEKSKVKTVIFNSPTTAHVKNNAKFTLFINQLQTHDSKITTKKVAQ